MHPPPLSQYPRSSLQHIPKFSLKHCEVLLWSMKLQWQMVYMHHSKWNPLSFSLSWFDTDALAIWQMRMSLQMAMCTFPGMLPTIHYLKLLLDSTCVLAGTEHCIHRLKTYSQVLNQKLTMRAQSNNYYRLFMKNSDLHFHQWYIKHGRGIKMQVITQRANLKQAYFPLMKIKESHFHQRTVQRGRGTNKQ